jgi:prepilin-type N-terminal cleavage/methylation domain-containing protein
LTCASSPATVSPMAESHGKRARSRRATRSDRGFTFVEVVVTVTLMAIVVAPILAAVSTAVRESSRSRSAAQVETTIVNAADRVNRAPKVCDYNVYVKAAVRAQQWDESRASIVEEHYVPPADLSQQGQWVPGACEIDTATDLLVQRITITIKSPDGKVSRTIQVVKSDV